MGVCFEESRNPSSLPKIEIWDREELVAQIRFVLAVACIVAASVFPECLGQRPGAGWLLLLYLTYSLGDIVALRLGCRYGRVSLLARHTGDLLLVWLITLFTGGLQSTFVGLYLYLLFAGACEWGFRGALLTSCACVSMSFLTFSLWAPFRRLYTIPLHTWVVFSAGLIAMGCLLGLVVERAQSQAEDELLIARLMRSCVPQPSFKEAVASALNLLRQHFDADQVRLALQEMKSDQVVVWELIRQGDTAEDALRSWNLTESVRQASMILPAEHMQRLAAANRAGGADRSGGHTRQRKHGAGELLATGFGRVSRNMRAFERSGEPHVIGEQHSTFGSSWSMLAASFAFEGKWLGRLTVYNPRNLSSRRAALRFLEIFVREVGPAILDKFKVGRLRSRAQSRERVRLVQELHDGIVQSLIGLEMQMDHLRRTQARTPDPAALLEELRRLQALLHNEIASVREEMQRIKPLQVEPNRLLEHIARAVDRFQRDQGIAARFVAQDKEIVLPPRVCTELVRIVQEALVNVRKHSGARNVLVTLGRDNGHYRLFIEDDGHGFGFTGPMSSEELDASPRCPLMVRERVRAIGGELMIESDNASGARLEILVPVTVHGRITSNS